MMRKSLIVGKEYRMLKMVTVFSRLPDWQYKHAALGREVAETLRVRRYVQSPRVPSRVINGFVAARGWLDDYDALTEVWWNSEADMLEALATYEGQKATQRLAADEAMFIDMKRVVSFLSEEREIIGGHEAAEGPEQIAGP
jgi:EthD domain